jgi:TonB family protein
VIASLAFSVLALAATNPPPIDTTGFALPIPIPGAAAPPPGGAFRTAAARDTALRVPGSPLRFGWTQERLATFGAFRRMSGSPPDAVRDGTCDWFGASGHAQVTFRDDRLSRIHLSLDSVAPHVLDYVMDEMRRQGFRLVDSSSSSGSQQWKWLGRTRATLATSGTSLIGDFELAPEVAPAPPPVPARLDTLDFLAAEAEHLPQPVRRFTPDPPSRPPAAVAAGLFGRVVVRALVDTSGVVIDASAMRGADALQSAALDWARAVRFEPYLERGHAVRFWIGLTTLFLPGPAAGKP